MKNLIVIGKFGLGLTQRLGLFEKTQGIHTIQVGIWIANIWIANFYFFIIQMVCYLDGTGHLNSRPVFKWWSECRSVNQTVIRIPNYHGVRDRNSEPFNEQSNSHDQIIQIPNVLEKLGKLTYLWVNSDLYLDSRP